MHHLAGNKISQYVFWGLYVVLFVSDNLFASNGLSSDVERNRMNEFSVSIMLLPKVSKFDQILELKDIALVYGAHASMFLKLKIPDELVTDRSDSSGMIHRKGLKEYLEKQYPDTVFEYSGRESILVERYETVLGNEEILNQIEVVLDKRLKQISDDYQYKRLSHIDKIYLPERAYRLEIRDNQKQGLLARECIWVDVFYTGERSAELMTSVPVWYKFEITKEVLVANSRAMSGQYFDINHFTMDKRNVAGVDFVDIKEVKSDVNTFRFKSMVNEGEILSWAQLEKTPDVEIGNTVQVKATYKHIEIITEALAVSDGNIGDKVLLKPLHSSEQKYQARVMGKNQALVENY